MSCKSKHALGSWKPKCFVFDMHVIGLFFWGFFLGSLAICKMRQGLRWLTHTVTAMASCHTVEVLDADKERECCNSYTLVKEQELLLLPFLLPFAFDIHLASAIKP